MNLLTTIRKRRKPSEESKHSHSRVYLFGALYATLLVAVVVTFGIIQYIHFYNSMERRLESHLEGQARSLARRYSPAEYRYLIDTLNSGGEESFKYTLKRLQSEAQALNVRRIVVFDEEYRVVLDTLNKLNRDQVDARLRVDQAEIERALASDEGLAVATDFYELSGEAEGSTRLAKAAYAVAVDLEGEVGSRTRDSQGQRYIIGVEMPAVYAFELNQLKLVILLVVSATSLFVLLTTIFATRSFVRLQLRFEVERRRAEHSDFSAGIAHELKNPLAAMLTGIQMIERRVPPSERKAFNRLERQIRSMDRIVKAFLAFARGAQREPERTTVRAIVSEVQKQLTPAQLRCLRVENTTDKLDLVIDQTALVQALSNLVKNGAQAALTTTDGSSVSSSPTDDPEESHGDSRVFAPGDPKVDLSVEQKGRSLVFTVTDNGKGIPDEVKARLFQPFVSGSHEGTGLGLAITKRLLDDIGGAVSLVASNRHGTVFQVEVPLNT